MTITKTIYLGALERPTWRDLRAFVQDIERREAAHENAITVVIEGGKLSASVERALTIAEEAQEWQRRFEALGDEIRAVLPPNNAEPLSTSDRMALMKAIFAIIGEPAQPQTGSDTPGTQAPAAGPATPNTNEPPPAETEAQRRARWDALLTNSGFEWPDDSIAITNMALQHGFTLGELAGWGLQ
ncbi:MAG: hypothetical protein RJA36_2407 [Pseudomonadota bacterium]|jgi:hypothetical protein